jgi:hypothetical protein
MSESLRHYQAVCREAFAFLISEHAFHELSNSANTLNSYIVEFGNGEILLRVLGESWGETARVEYTAHDGRLVPSTLLEPDWEPKPRRRKKPRPKLPSQDDQIRAAAERIRVRDQEILQGNYVK